MKDTVSSEKLIPFLNEKFKTDIKAKGSVIERKEVFINQVSSVNEDEGTIDCIITTQDVDRSGDVVVSRGIDTTDFQKIPSVFINHNYSLLPIGTCESLTHKEDKIEAKVKFVLTVPAIKNIFELIKAGALKGISIGFEVLEYLHKGQEGFKDMCKELGVDEERVGRIFTKWALYEFSVCSLPCNQECYIKSLGDNKQTVDPELGKYLGFPELKEVKSEKVEEVKEEPKIEKVVEVPEIKVEEVKVEVHKEPEVVVTKAVPRYITILRTPEDVDEYIKKAVEAKKSGKLSIDW